MGLRALCSGHNWALAEAGVTEVQQGAGLTRGVTGTGERVATSDLAQLEMHRMGPPSPLGLGGASGSRRGHLVPSGTMMAPSFPLPDHLYSSPTPPDTSEYLGPWACLANNLALNHAQLSPLHLVGWLLGCFGFLKQGFSALWILSWN